MCSTCSVVWSIAVPVAELPLELPADAMTVLAALDEDVGRERWEPRADLPDMQVVDVGHALRAPEDSARPRSGSIPSGAASRSTRPEARSSGQAAASIDAATASDAIGSARSKPVVHTTTPGQGGPGERVEVGEQVAVAALHVEVGAICPGDLAEGDDVDDRADDRRRDDDRRPHVRGSKRGGARPRRRSGGPRTSIVAPLTWAERISARRKPKVIRPPAGRSASRAAQTLSPSAAASTSMCAASESRASELATTPSTTSTAMNARIRTSATASGRASVPAPTPWS